MSQNPIKKTHSSSFKFDMVLNYLKGEKTAKELSKEHNISFAIICLWTKKFKELGKNIFDQQSILFSAKKEISALQKKIEELTAATNLLKKVFFT